MVAQRTIFQFLLVRLKPGLFGCKTSAKSSEIALLGMRKLSLFISQKTLAERRL